MEIKSETTVPTAEVKKILSERSKAGELAYEQKTTLDYLSKHCKITQTKFNKLQTELKTLEKLSERHISAIINFLPKDLDDLRLLFANERVDLTPTEKERVLEIVNKD